MNIPLFDQTREGEKTPYGGGVRLSNELRAIKANTIPKRNELGVISGFVDARWGFNCETAPYSDFVKWLSVSVKRSPSKFWFVIRIMAWRFEKKHTEIRNNLSPKRKLEFDLILSQMKKEQDWLGRVDLQNMVLLESANPLNLKNIEVVKKRNEKFVTRKK